MKYFVLKPGGKDEYGTASRAALRTYADSIVDQNPGLALDLRQWALAEEKNLFQTSAIPHHSV